MSKRVENTEKNLPTWGPSGKTGAGQLREMLLRYARMAALRYSGSWVDAEDIAHDAYLKLLLHPRIASGETPATAAYIYAVVRHTAIDKLRTLGRLPKALNISEHEAELAKVDTLRNDALQAAFNAAVLALSSREFEVLRMRTASGMDNQAIAEALGLAPSTISETEKRAKEKILQHLKAACADDPMVDRLMARLAST